MRPVAIDSGGLAVSSVGEVGGERLPVAGEQVVDTGSAGEPVEVEQREHGCRRSSDADDLALFVDQRDCLGEGLAGGRVDVGDRFEVEQHPSNVALGDGRYPISQGVGVGEEQRAGEPDEVHLGQVGH